MKATQIGELGAQADELRERRLHGLGHQVQRHVVRGIDQRIARDSRAAARRRADPALSERQPRNRELLGHVIELVPLVVGSMLPGIGDLGEREKADLYLVHGSPPCPSCSGMTPS
jgi:hypothetical protein